ncbi:hypothetical protein AUR64_08155 [Haloprofundus marisrubri]|uniref:DUF4336 domain-containing protein n=1 Tax=Haloprofundus marisrubri TaxID=1514971 RepID=A0A0W1RB38_9EURY|nr:DUF4336 domain-containing protein [Haloprofundus marisrubri]KTG10628.1 hypothetical protein AUR64_08155 [Haloprofundus marisrubri]
MTATSDVLDHLDTGLWTYREPLRFFGLEIGRVMVVVRLSSGGLLIYSPAELTADLRGALAELGDVRFVVPASKLHGHLYMEQYREAYPRAELLAAPGLDRRRTDLDFDGLLGGTPDPRWSADLDQTAFLGHRWLTEIEFYHRPSRTLILGDICYHVTGDAPLSTRAVARLAGMYGRLAVPPDLRRTIVNEDAARNSVRKILAWEFDRVLVGHGSVLESGGRAAVADAFDWLR